MRAQSTQPVDRTDDIETLVRALLRDVLSLSQERADAFEADTPLFGALPELDSMAGISPAIGRSAPAGCATRCGARPGWAVTTSASMTS